MMKDGIAMRRGDAAAAGKDRSFPRSRRALGTAQSHLVTRGTDLARRILEALHQMAKSDQLLDLGDLYDVF
jgi:hypothetical protein